MGYEMEGNRPCVLLEARQDRQALFGKFRRQFQVGAVIDVEMVRVLEDPLGRNPVFLVRELVTGLEIPMADSDFCGDTWPRAFFGRRFAIGEQFQVRVETVERSSQQVRVSRGRQLLKQYLNIL